jgi:hypothetical protein
MRPRGGDKLRSKNPFAGAATPGLFEARRHAAIGICSCLSPAPFVDCVFPPLLAIRSAAGKDDDAHLLGVGSADTRTMLIYVRKGCLLHVQVVSLNLRRVYWIESCCFPAGACMGS